MTLPSPPDPTAQRSLDGPFRLLADAMDQEALVIDEVGACLFVNAAWSRTTGQTAAAAFGDGWRQALPPDDADRLAGSWAVDDVGTGRVVEIVLGLVDASGSAWRRSGRVRILDPAAGWWLVTLDPPPGDPPPPLEEAAVAESSATSETYRLRDVLDSLFAFVGVMTTDGTLIEANRAPLEAAGLTAADVIGRKFWDCPWWDYDPSVQAQLRAACERAARGIPSRYDVPVRMAGGLMTIDFTIVPLCDATGRITHLIPSAVDVSERVRVAGALRESESTARRQLAEIQATYDAAPIGLCVLDADLRWVRINERLAEINGVPAADHIGRTVSEVLPDIGDAALTMLRSVIATGRPVHDVEVVGETPAQPGVRRTWIEHFIPIRDPDGRVAGINVVCEEVTEKKRAAESLRRSLERTSLALAAGRMGTWEWDIVSGRVGWSDELYELMRLTPEEFSPTLEGFVERVVPEDREAFRSYVEAAVAGRGCDYEVQCRVVRGDGAVRWLAGHGTIRRDADGNALGIVGVTADQTERIEGEKALRASEARLRRVIQNSLVGVALWDGLGGIREANPAFLRLLGRREDELAAGSLTWDDLSAPQQRDRLRGALDAVGQRGVCPPFEAELIHRDGHLVPVLMSGVTYEAQGGDTGLAFVVDLTERKRSEAALRESDRRKGEFLAVLSHELRNPLAALRNALQLVDGDANEPDLAWAMGVIDRQSTHLKHLIDDLLDLNRVDQGKITLRTRRVLLDELLAHAVEAIRPAAAGHGHRLRFVRADRPVEIEADPTRVEQVVMNLLSNAVKYTPDGGLIVLSSRVEENRAVIRVADTGVGIAPEMLPHIFEMFAQVGRSLDRAQGGLGIGLSLARSLVEMHGGTILARSDGPGLGSEFEVRLPLAAGGDDRPAPPTSSPVSTRSAAVVARPLRLLLVDDNVDSALGLQRLLRRQGHDVRVVHDGPAALEAARAERPDVVVLDIGMPGMDGYQVAIHLRREHGDRRPGLIALSGFGQNHDRDRSREAGFDGHLVKPVDLDALIHLLAAFGD